MSGVELGLGILGAVDLAIKACKKVTQLCSTLKHADEEVREKRTRLESNCVQMEIQLDIFRQIQDHLDERIHILQISVIDTLTCKLGIAESKLSSLIADSNQDIATKNAFTRLLSKREKLKYATVLKKDLEESIEDIEKWQLVSFNPLWFTVVKTQAERIDKYLVNARTKASNQSQQVKTVISEALTVRKISQQANSGLFLSSEKVEQAETAKVLYSSVRMVKINDSWRLLDLVTHISKDTVRDLAGKLRSSNPSFFGLLKCLGATYDDKKKQSDLVFGIPDKMSEPKTLRQKLLANDLSHSLSERFSLAIQLARAVCSLHTFDIVHKSIRPENILLLKDDQSSLGSAFLLGFENIRRDQDNTRLAGDTDWYKNLYRHPQRQGSKISERYIMQHDIYSLGVCLLEIGLWRSFVRYEGSTPELAGLDIADLSTYSSEDESSFEITKALLLSMVPTELKPNMGTKYAKIVESCLTCLDIDNEDFVDESDSRNDEVFIATKYITKVLAQLNAISI